MEFLKKNGIHFVIIALFFGICFVYFLPAFQGKALGQSDVVDILLPVIFHPASYYIGETISLIASVILTGAILYSIFKKYRSSV